MPPGTDPDPGIYRVVGAMLDGYTPVTDTLERDGLTYYLCVVDSEWRLSRTGYKVTKETAEKLAAGEGSGSTFTSGGAAYRLAIDGDFVTHVAV